MAAKDLLADDDVRRWYQNLARGSEGTAAKNLGLLARYCRLESTTPTGIIQAYEEDRKAFLDRFMDFIEAQRNGVGNGGKPRADSYLKEYVTVLSSWIRHHHLDPPRGIKVGDAGATPTLAKERIPTREQLRAILHRASLRARAIIALMAFSGLRPQVLGNGTGTDGLCMGDLPDFALKGSTVMVRRTPARIDVRRELSKARRAFFTFLGEEGCDILQAYLQSRVDGGERLEAGSPVIRCTPGWEKGGKRVGARNFGSLFLVSRNVSREVRRAFGPGFKHRPYVLRSYFDTNLLFIEGRIGLQRDFRVFWMGHRGDIEHRYTLHKVLSPELVEEMRAAYAKAEPYLSTVTLRQDSRQIAEADVSGEQYSVTVAAASEKWAHKTDEEKLLAFITQVARKNDLFRAALREALRE